MDNKTFQLLFVGVSLGFPQVHVSPKLPLAQAKLESANWKSPNWLNNNNMFGMTVPQLRSTTATNKTSVGKYAHYDNVLDGVTDYFRFLDQLGIYDDAALEKKLRGNYATDPQYFLKVSNIVTQLTTAGEYLDTKLIYAGASVAALALGYGAVKAVQSLTS